MSEPDKTSNIKRIIPFAQAIIVALVAWGIYRAFVNAKAELTGQQIQFSSIRWRWLFLSGGFYAIGASAMGWFWYVLLRRLDQQPTFYATMRAFFIGHLGKYVPGKFMVVLIRTGLLKSSKVDATIAATSVFVDTLTMMAAGAFLSGVILLVRFRDQRMLQLVAFGLMVLTAAFTIPPVLKTIIRKLKSRESAERMSEILDRLNWSTLAIGWACALVCWCFYGLSLWAVIRSLPLADGSVITGGTMVDLVASVSLATVGGFVSLVPGGILVREWVLNQLMTPAFGAVVSLVAPAVLRIVWLLTEILVSIILYICVPRSQH